MIVWLVWLLQNSPEAPGGEERGLVLSGPEQVKTVVNDTE